MQLPVYFKSTNLKAKNGVCGDDGSFRLVNEWAGFEQCRAGLPRSDLSVLGEPGRNWMSSKDVFLTDNDKWAAVVRRDRAADTVFYYSVRTTGVYCRPSCAARLARRENVRFHRTCADAERAGFRPCKRCRPNEAPLAERQAAAVAQACRLIENSDEIPGLGPLAESAGMSRFYFHRLFKAITGLTPKSYAAAHRAGRVRNELSRGATVTDAIYGAGYN